MALMAAKKHSDPEQWKESYLKTFKWMVFGRSFEDKIAALYRAGKITGGVYLGRGQEAFSAALGAQLDQSGGDIFAGLIRDQAGRMAFGEPLIDAARTYLGSVEGPMKGRDGNIHRGLPSKGMPAMISHLGSLIAVVNGMLIAKRFKGESGVVGGATIGDGGTSTGAFHEAMNQAAVEKLPLVVAVANNQYAYSTKEDRQFACESLVDRAKGYGVSGYSIDGTDPLECVEVFSEAISKARSGAGPQMVVGRMLRLAGHGEHDDARYVAASAREDHFGRDCNKVAVEQILQNGWMTEMEIEQLKQRIQKEVEEATVQAQSESSPSPVKETWQAISSSDLVESENTWRS
ncbi:MAG: thiamine pyrophosphate-dependent dehydrogenase E1 component subunit alpha [Verrucomicrobiales bacterium]|nr:thiamine pyrophosphate-dependent dehydrogenase E1 component subunit alpha [Verrucomicrobiales bacterium]